jgi:shikimate dehydrogenase
MEDASDHGLIVTPREQKRIRDAAHATCGSPAAPSRDTWRMPEISGTTTLVGIIGDPVSHSLSPRMQNAGFAALGLDWAYVPLRVEAARVGDAVRGLVALGFAGANVTIPHKGAVIEHCDEVDGVAADAGSVNTLVVRDGWVHGSSTDVVALQAAADATGRRVLVLGRGGAAKAAAAAYRAQGAAAVDAVSRRDEGWPPDAAGYDVIVNCTPVKDAPIVQVEPHHTIVDMAYLPDRSPTALAAAGRAAGCVVVDGLRLLLDQGAASFERWTGQAAPREAMAAALGL